MYDYFRCGGIAVGDPTAVDDYALRADREYDTHVNHLARSPLQVQFKNVLCRGAASRPQCSPT